MIIIKLLPLVGLSILMTLLFPEFSDAYKKLTDKGYGMFANLTDAENVVVMDYLRPMLIPRSSGTSNNKKVREFIMSHYRGLGWHIDEDKFTEMTPIGEVEFDNIIVTKNINASRRLVLAAHYDSKYFSSGDKFVGATDSGLSCALLIDLAHRMDPYLMKNGTTDSTTIQMIFFDGEEAFKTWSPTDSLYGSRHLAKKWETDTANMTSSFQYKADSMLDGIDTFILLDLLGAKKPTIMNFFHTTSWMFKEMSDIEENLHRLNLLKDVHQIHTGHDHDHSTVIATEDTDDDEENFKEISMFDESSLSTFQAHIEDDHIPFLQKGVPVLHLIPYPFPDVWHSVADNFSAIDPGTVYNLNSVLRIFLLEYFEIDASKYIDIGG